ncbi:MAG: hypothetical protein ACFBSF_13585, partial [Leptolyngbyaceae cyanobacterium]
RFSFRGRLMAHSGRLNDSVALSLTGFDSLEKRSLDKSPIPLTCGQWFGDGELMGPVGVSQGLRHGGIFPG